jgi:hypothetical protein
MRLDIRVDAYSADNKPMSSYFKKLTKWIRKTYRGPVGYIWVREQTDKPVQHYHVVIMLNGKVIRHPQRIITKAEAIAEDWYWPKPHTPDNCFYDIRPKDKSAYREAFRRVSYLAKQDTKQGKGESARYFGRSQVKPKRKTEV